MTRSSTSAALALCSLLLVGAAARGQDALPDGQALLKDAAGYDAALESPLRLGIYMAGVKNMGTATLEVRRAEAPATYALTARQDMRLGRDRKTGTEEFLLDERLALISTRSTEEETKAGKVVKKTTTIRREGDVWIREVQEEGAAPKTQRLVASGPMYADVPVLITFLRKADLSAPGEWRLQSVRWEGPELRTAEVRIRIPAARTKVVHRGREVEVTEVSLERVGRDVSTVAIDAQGNVLSLELEGAPVSMVAGTEEEITADLPAATPAVEPGVETPLECVRIYLEVLIQVRKVDALDQIVDWQGVLEQLGANDPNVAAMGAEGIRAVIKQSVGQGEPPFTPDQLEEAMQAVTLTNEGDDAAKVTLVGAEEKPFVLRRGPRGWRIVGLPN